MLLLVSYNSALSCVDFNSPFPVVLSTICGIPPIYAVNTVHMATQSPSVPVDCSVPTSNPVSPLLSYVGSTGQHYCPGQHKVALWITHQYRGRLQHPGPSSHGSVGNPIGGYRVGESTHLDNSGYIIQLFGCLEHEKEQRRCEDHS
jgi:hypothetical protein